LPPSGASANQNLWFEAPHSVAPVEGSLEEQQPPLQGSEGAELKNTPSGELLSGDGASIGNNEQASPLNTIGQMQSSLPDIPGKGSSPE